MRHDPGGLVAELLGPAGRADPYPVYRRLHEYGPVVPVAGGAVLVVGYEAAAAALRDPRLRVEDASHLDRVASGWRERTSRSLLGRTMLLADGDEHARLRGLVRRAFTARQVDRLRPTVTRRVAELLDRLAELGAGCAGVDLMAEFATTLPVSVIADLLGVPDDARRWLRRPVAELAMALEPGWLGLDLAAADAAAEELAEYFGTLVALRRARPGDDLVSGMIAAGDAADDELVANAVLMLLAGFETTAGLLGNAVALLLDRPAARAALRVRPAAVVEEILRYEAPVQLTGRRTAVDLRLGDVAVPAGTTVVIVLGAANRDPRRFDDPDRFAPGRADGAALSFGGGAHFCLGARLARAEAAAALPALFERFPGLARGGAATRLDRFNLRAHERLPLVLSGPVTAERGSVPVAH